MSRLWPVLLETAAVATVMVAALPTATLAVTLESAYQAWADAAGSAGVETSVFDVDGSAAGNNMPVDGVTLADGMALTFDPSMLVAQIGESWASWYDDYEGQVLNSNGATTVNFAVSPAVAFGMYIEPANPSVANDITLTLSDGQTVSQSLSGDASAAFFGWVGAGIGQFSISSDGAYGGGFAVGEFYASQSPVSAPEPGSLPILGGMLAGVGFARRRRRIVSRADDRRSPAPRRRRNR
jgi:hypothetical protein